MKPDLTRRTLLAAGGLALFRPASTRAASRKSLSLELVWRDLVLRPGQPATRAARFADAAPRLTQGDEVDVTINNRLSTDIWIVWRGLDGAPALEPLLARRAIVAGASDTFPLSLRHAGTLVCDARLGANAPLPLLPIVIGETSPPDLDRDEVLLVEDWRLRPDGSAIAPGADPAGLEPMYRLNGASRPTITAKPESRLRLRFINGAQHSVIAITIPGIEIRVIAIDGQPAESFLARDSRIVMAPGTRLDAMVNVNASGSASEIVLNDGVRSVVIGDIVASDEPKRTVPHAPLLVLPSNGLPERLPLQSALRIDLTLDGSSDWLRPQAIDRAAAPAFRMARGRTGVLALSNPAASPTIFRLHGHHMRLLDRLDDGWKPFWLDTIVVPAGQTIRVAFGATTAGRYLMEMASMDWNSPTLLRSYAVDG